MKKQTDRGGMGLRLLSLRSICGLLVVFMISWHSATTADSEYPVNRILTETKSFSAEFLQISIDESGNPGKPNIGKFYLSKPGRFRWNYHSPYKQEIVANGEKVWFYDADLEQVTVKQIGTAIGSTPALLLTGQVDLDDNFIIEDLGVKDGKEWIKLIPKGDDNTFKYIAIGVQGNLLQGMELSDNFGQLTRIMFSEIELNNEIPPAIFEFVAPPGVDVFDEG